eukprot:1181931-Prorocentrum_minimum.AAC.11
MYQNQTNSFRSAVALRRQQGASRKAGPNSGDTPISETPTLKPEPRGPCRSILISCRVPPIVIARPARADSGGRSLQIRVPSSNGVLPLPGVPSHDICMASTPTLHPFNPIGKTAWSTWRYTSPAQGR